MSGSSTARTGDLVSGGITASAKRAPERPLLPRTALSTLEDEDETSQNRKANTQHKKPKTSRKDGESSHEHSNQSKHSVGQLAPKLFASNDGLVRLRSGIEMSFEKPSPFDKIGLLEVRWFESELVYVLGQIDSYCGKCVWRSEDASMGWFWLH